MKMLSLYYHELMEKFKEYKGKKYSMIDDYVLDEVLDKTKEIIATENLMILKFWLT